MKRFIALLLACMMLATCASAETITVAEKLYRQLWAGSGFSGTLTLEVNTQSFRTAQPMDAKVDYIYVRPDEANGEPAKHRVDVQLQKDETPVTAAHAQLKEGKVSFQADVLSADWFVLDAQGQKAAVSQSVEQAAVQTGTPALARTVAAAAAAMYRNDALIDAMDSYLTRVDVWIEGYRQDAVLSETADGVTVMQVHYVLPPAAVKAQVKQLIVDLLHDEKALPLLAEALGEEKAALYLNPALQNWYFAAVDALPFPGDLTLSRTLAMTGETVDLHLSLPMYDAQAGVVTVSYDRTRGAGDLPEENVIRVETEEREISLTYQAYSSMTGVQVMQGTLLSRPVQNFAVEEDAQIIAADFTLKAGSAESVDEQGRNVQTCEFALSFAPAEDCTADFEATEITFNARFASPQLLTASTQVVMQLHVVNGENEVTASFDGASRKKWTPDYVPAGTLIESFDQKEIAQLLPGALLRTMAVLQPFTAE